MEDIVLAYTYKGETLRANLVDVDADVVLQTINTPNKTLFKNISQFRNALVVDEKKRNGQQISNIDVYFGNKLLEKYSYFRGEIPKNEWNLARLRTEVLKFVSENPKQTPEEEKDEELDVDEIIPKLLSLSLEKRKKIISTLLPSTQKTLE